MASTKGLNEGVVLNHFNKRDEWKITKKSVLGALQSNEVDTFLGIICQIQQYCNIGCLYYHMAYTRKRKIFIYNIFLR